MKNFISIDNLYGGKSWVNIGQSTSIMEHIGPMFNGKPQFVFTEIRMVDGTIYSAKQSVEEIEEKLKALEVLNASSKSM